MKTRAPAPWQKHLITVLLQLLPGWAMAAGTLPLAEYLGQVENKNDGIRASLQLSRGAELRTDEGKLLLEPKLFARASFSSDEREQIAPDFQGKKTTINTYSLGVKQSTSYGLDASLHYDLSNATISGANPLLVPQPSYYTGSPILELSQSLWGNGFGTTTRATQRRLEALATATRFSEAFSVKTARANAEVAYWNLALVRATVAVERDSLGRFEKMRDLHRRKVSTGLSDRADFLQAAAAADSRRLDLANALDQEKAASRDFNTARGLEQDSVPEDLEPITEQVIDRMRVPEKVDLRENVLAARAQENAEIADAEIGREANLPNLRAFATLSLNGRDAAVSKTTPESFTLKHPYNSVGIEFSAPLDVGKVARSREGYALNSSGNKLKYERTLYEEDRLWNDLRKRFEESKARLTLARQVQATQKEKLDYERERHARGRTTTFQVLQFEQDYANSQLAYIQAQGTLLQSTAQLKTFGGSQ